MIFAKLQNELILRNGMVTHQRVEDLRMMDEENPPPAKSDRVIHRYVCHIVEPAIETIVVCVFVKVVIAIAIKVVTTIVSLGLPGTAGKASAELETRIS